MRKSHLFILAASVAVAVLTQNPCPAANLPKPTGKFTFDARPNAGMMVLNGELVTNNTVYLTGRYKWPGVILRPSRFDYKKFTAVVKLRPEKISPGTTLLVGGLSCRWFVLETGSDGKVEISFNNHEFKHPIDNVVLTNGEWVTLGLTFDLESRKAMVYRDGEKKAEITLPEKFELRVISSEEWAESDKNLTFTDGSYGRTFSGLVGGVLTFDEVLSPAQMRQLFPRNSRK